MSKRDFILPENGQAFILKNNIEMQGKQIVIRNFENSHSMKTPF